MDFVSLQEGFKSYFLAISDSETARLRECGFWNIRHYLRLGMNQALIRAATKCWDPEANLFRFGEQELCPLPEEFSTLMGIQLTRTSRVANPCLYNGPQWQLFSQFSLTADDKELIFKQQGADMHAILNKLRSITPRDTRWIHLVRLMILGCYLCEQPSGFCCYRLVSLVRQVA